MDSALVTAIHSTPKPEKNEDAIDYFQTWHKHVSPTGLYGINIPVKYGGLGLGHRERFFAISEMSRVDPSAGAILQSINLGIGLFLSGPEPLREKWLPKLASGEEIASICITEPEAGARIGKIETLLTHQKNGTYALFGTKQFIANSHIATVHGVIARADTLPNHHHSHIALIAQASLEGVCAGKIDRLNGLRHFNIGKVHFKNANIPRNCILEGHNGTQLAHRSITLFGKLNLAAVTYGALLQSWDKTLEYLDSDSAREKTLENIGAVRRLIGDVQGRITETRALCHAAAASIDRGEPQVDLILTAKTRSVDNALRGIIDCISLMGPVVEKHLLDTSPD